MEANQSEANEEPDARALGEAEEEEEEEEQEEQDAGAAAGAGGRRRSGRTRVKNVTLRDQGWDESSSSEEDTSEFTGGLVGVCRRSGRRRVKNVTLKDQGWDQSSCSQSSSGEEEEESEPEAEAAVDGADGKYTAREHVGGAESSEEKEEEEEMGCEVVSGVETVSVEKRTVDHEVYTSPASCFCSACRVRDNDKCFVFAAYPALVPKLRLSVVQEKVVMNTGVDPVREDGKVDGRKKKGNQIPQEEQRLFDAEGYRYTV